MAYREGSRKPTAKERAAMVHLSKSLDRAYVPGTNVAKVAKVAPPGRLNTRSLVSARQQRTAGMRVTATPFTERRVTHTPKAAIKIAFAGDVSGSMGSLSKPLAITRWMVSEAGYQCHAKVGAVLFGSRVYAIQRPGKRVMDVESWSAVDSTEVPSTAWAFLDQEMQFLKDKNSARFMVWFTDFEFVDEREADAFWAAMDEAKRAGVFIIGVVPNDHDIPNAARLGIEHLVVVGYNPPIEVAKEIGAAILKAVQHGKDRR